MSDIVIVPTFDRPEYLWVCLDKLFNAYGVLGKEIWVCEDNHLGQPKGGWASIEMIAVLEEARRKFGDYFRYIHRTPHESYGNSFNVLEALRAACWTDARRIYLVEDDVMVMPDFFHWHEAVQLAECDRYVSCAERYNHSLNFLSNGQYVLDEAFKDPMAYIVEANVYSSLGVCFPYSVLSRFMNDHGHLGKMAGSWSTEKFGPGQEQDLIIKKDLQRTRTHAIWPYVPRCYHMGWYGYHRNTGMKFNGTLEEKVKALESTMVNPGRIKDMASTQDIEAYPKSQIVWDGNVYETRKYR